VATNRKLRSALLEKLGVSQQRLSQRVQRRKAELPMSTELATYTIAHEEGIDVSRFLDPDLTAQVRELVAQLRATGERPAPTSARRARSGTPRPVLVTVAGVKVERLPGMTASHAREAKMMAQKVYPALYVFENSARDVISRVLKAGVGDDWWDCVVPKKLKEKASQRKADETKDPWHGKRGAALIDYLDFGDLPSIVRANKAWPHFKPIFPRAAWFEELVSDLNVSRRVAAHMNPLESDDVKNVEAAFRKWAKLLKARESLLP
jgi:hypothetical protein